MLKLNISLHTCFMYKDNAFAFKIQEMITVCSFFKVNLIIKHFIVLLRFNMLNLFEVMRKLTLFSK